MPEKTLFEEEEWELELDTPAIPPQFVDELVGPPPKEDLHDSLWLDPMQIESYYRMAAPGLVRTGDKLVGPCPLDACGGLMSVPLKQGYFVVEGGCRDQGSIYGFEMRMRGLTFYDALQRIRKWVVKKPPLLSENKKKRKAG